MTARWATTRLRMAPHCALSAATASTAGTRRGRAAAPVTSAPRGTSRIFTASVSSATRVSSVTATALLGHTSEVCPSPRATTGSRKSQPSATSAGTLAYAAAETRRAQAAALLGRKGPCVPPARRTTTFRTATWLKTPSVSRANPVFVGTLGRCSRPCSPSSAAGSRMPIRSGSSRTMRRRKSRSSTFLKGSPCFSSPCRFSSY
mmetsp:Transcript_91777/g.262433  ORF Transcript_91777/g.262433 Transcript_91777/m.262433 type:complete len:204 (+) Transcript_91777:1615-2226(+)